jgi:hypothetical protein
MDKAAYITIEGCEYNDTRAQYEKQMEGIAIEDIKGDANWFNRLVNGPWESDDFLNVPPGGTVVAMYDMKEVMG